MARGERTAAARSPLARRLAELRKQWGLEQKDVAGALGVGSTSISGWENGRTVPGEDRLRQYALFFATRRSLEGGVQLLDAAELTADESLALHALEAELLSLAGDDAPDAVEVAAFRQLPTGRTEKRGRLGGRFWHFPDGGQITILCTPFSCRQFGIPGPGQVPADAPPVVQYAVNPSHPNAVTNLLNADIDALLELVGHLRAENPHAEVRWKTYDQVADTDLITGHLVILGAADNIRSTPMQTPTAPTARLLLADLRRRLDLPIQVPDSVPPDVEFDFPFVDRLGQEYRPEFLALESGQRLTNAGAPVLTSDVALVVRKPNPFNPSFSATVLSGLFSRGTYAAVRVFTDAAFRERNEQYVWETFGAADFWMLLRVKVAGGLRTVTPSLAADADDTPADLLAASMSPQRG